MSRANRKARTRRGPAILAASASAALACDAPPSELAPCEPTATASDKPPAAAAELGAIDLGATDAVSIGGHSYAARRERDPDAVRVERIVLERMKEDGAREEVVLITDLPLREEGSNRGAVRLVPPAGEFAAEAVAVVAFFDRDRADEPGIAAIAVEKDLAPRAPEMLRGPEASLADAIVYHGHYALALCESDDVASVARRARGPRYRIPGARCDGGASSPSLYARDPSLWLFAGSREGDRRAFSLYPADGELCPLPAPNPGADRESPP